MLRKAVLVAFLGLVSVSAFAFDRAEFKRSLKELAAGISQTAYSVSERPGSAERGAFEGAADRADRAEKSIREIVGSISNADEFSAAEKCLSDFAAGSELNAHTVAVVEKLLKQRAAFVTSDTSAASVVNVRSSGRVAAPGQLLSRSQRRLIMIETPMAEAVISLEDTKKNRRLDNLKEIFKRHGCRIISENTDESGKEAAYGFYFSGKKYVVDALLGHFGGDIVQADLKAVVKLTTGGFWSGKKTVEFNIAPDSDNGVMGELSWYKSVIEKDPTKYLAENNYSKLATLGSIETIAGEKKLQLKNAIAEIWVMSKNGSVTNAVYTSKVELGDIFVDAR
ncbi:MAG: hypothetical protein EOM80_06725 [Erysipelotrichia bacterium]|nr:hypothetical protein [Erysipelotrichia bacterium]